MPSLPLPTKSGRRAGTGIAVALTVALVGASCADEGEPPDTATLAAGELEGWSAVDSYEHADVLPFDQVAAAPADDGAVWFTRASGDGDDLAVWVTSGGQEASEVQVGMPDAVAIPVGVAADGTGWAAVAVTRDRPNGGNTGVVAWRSSGSESASGSSGSGSSDSRPAPTALEPPRGGVPASVTVGRAAGVDVVAGIVDGEVTTWVSGDDGWSAGTPRLAVDAEGGVASARVTGAGERFVLAAVDRSGRPHLWASPDGLAWTAVDPAGAPGGLAAVGMLAPLGDDGAAAVGWLPGDATAEDVAREAAEVVVQRVDGDAATDYGTITAEPDEGVERIDVNGAATRGEWLIVVGAAVDANGNPTPGVWAGAGDGGDFARSSQENLVDQPGHEFRAVTASGDGALYGVVTERPHIDVHLWRSDSSRN